MENIIIITWLIISLILGGLLIRNNKVYSFRIFLAKCFFTEFYHDKQMMDIYSKRPSYNKMLYSLKRLRFESFFNKEVCKKIQQTKTYTHYILNVLLLVSLMIGVSSCEHRSGHLQRTAYRDSATTGSYYEPNELTGDPESMYERVVIIAFYPDVLITNTDTIQGYTYKVNRIEEHVVDYIWDARMFNTNDTIFASFE